ncbi:MAG: beta-propeller fold lactonase family protein [Lachnospiraceae bacterium]|nr:beta-propeller fold lactonase family protein [Lachnospiraceae bacterium]
MRYLISGYVSAGTNGIYEMEQPGKDGQPDASPLLIPRCAETERSTWLLAHPGGKLLYAAEERRRADGEGTVAVLAMEGDRWPVMMRIPSGGGAPCHLSFDDRTEYLFISNYRDGFLTVWRLGKDGMPEAETDRIGHDGHGPNASRQECAHLHSALYDGGVLYAADLGLDTVFAYTLGRESGRLSETGRFLLPPGSGPRHTAVHPAFPDLLYVDGEMSGDIYVLDRRGGSILQTVSAVPQDMEGDYTASALRFDGDTLYCSMRFRDAIVQFSLLPDGLLSSPVITPHRQKTPRDVLMTEGLCLTADQDSMGVTIYRREGSALRELSFVETPGVRATCILPLS